MTELTRRQVLKGVAAAALLPTTGAAAAAGPATSGKGDALPATKVAGAPRERLPFDFDWRFQLGHASDPAKDFGYGRQQSTYAKAGYGTADAALAEFRDDDWQNVNLPHDWAVGLPFAASDFRPGIDAEGRPTDDPRAAHGFKPLGRQFPDTSVGWYRRSFEVPAADLGRRISLEFDGVFRDCTVFCNGYVVGRNASGYAPFRIELTDFLNYGGTNQLAVRVDASLGEGWFYEGAGIYRHVWLVKTHALHIPQWASFARADLKAGAATLQLGTEVCNDGAAAHDCSVEFVVRAPAGHVVARAQSAKLRVAPGETRPVLHGAELANPELWSLETPRLYTLECRVVAGSAVDAQSTPFGIRSIHFDANRGFFLNGKPVKILGTCNHQDHAGVGVALPDRLHQWRIEKLKEMGSNAYRTAHNPPAPELLDACDRLGMLVLDETRVMSSDDEGLSQLSRMIRRDRNHPSVVLWSLGNEEPQQGSERGARVVSTMKRLVTSLDPTRPTIIAMDKSFGEGAGAVVDVVGINYRTDKIGDWHERFPGRPVLGTETGSTVGTRGIYQRDDVKGYVRAYDVDFPWWASNAESWWDYVERRPFIAGGFVWTGFDYRGEPTPFNRWPAISSQFGIMDTCGFPKDNYWYYQAQWKREPVLHLFPHWNWQASAGETIDVWCHTNLERVELFHNGTALGGRDVPKNGHVEWKVPNVPGALEARGYRGGTLALTARRETTGAAARIALHPDRAALSADGMDVCMVTVEVQDAAGRVMPIADNALAFRVTGPGRIIGVGNGDPTSLEPDQATARRAFNGLAQVILQCTREAGSITLEAVSPGLTAATLTVQTRAAA